MRNKIRKAEKNNIVVSEDKTLEFATTYFDMLKTVFHRKGLAPTYTLGRVENILKNLHESKNVITITAQKDSQPISTILLLKDRRTFYYWGGASYQEAFKYGANDSIHWYAFQLAKKLGVHYYDTCGGGEYKKKFGGTYVQIPTAHKSMNTILPVARNIVKKSLKYKQIITSYLARFKRRK